MRRMREHEKDGQSSGQSTLEFALVTFALVAVLVALGALWRWVAANGLVERAIAAASHVWCEGGVLGDLGDVLMY